MSNELGGYLSVFNLAKDIQHISAIYGKKDKVTDYNVIEIFMYLNCKNWNDAIVSGANEIYSK